MGVVNVTENKFMVIYDELVHQIKTGHILPNSLLPSENELAAQYDSSRETIRKALHLLSQNGYIQKVRGKGSVVLDVGRLSFPVSGLVSFKELANASKADWKTTCHELILMKPNDILKQQLKVKSQAEIWRIARTREIEGEKVILDIDYIKKQYVPSLTKEICEHSIYAYFEETLGLMISFAKKEITVEEVTEEDQFYLDLKGMTHVVVVRNYVHLEDASLLQYTESRHRLDKFRFVDFARREHR